MRILFVCLGNICRSSAAQGVLESMVAAEGVDVTVDSAGTYGGHAGELPDRRMRVHANQRGYHLTHRSRKVKPSDFDDFDIIIAMDGNNYYDLREMAPSTEAESKIRSFAYYLRHHDNSYVPDPYYEGSEGFELVLDLLEDGCETIIDLIRKNEIDKL